MSRKMFAAVAHASAKQAVHQAFGQQADVSGVSVEGAVANHTALAVIQIKHGREAEIHPTRAQFRRQQKANS